MLEAHSLALSASLGGRASSAHHCGRDCRCLNHDRYYSPYLNAAVISYISTIHQTEIAVFLGLHAGFGGPGLDPGAAAAAAAGAGRAVTGTGAMDIQTGAQVQIVLMYT